MHIWSNLLLFLVTFGVGSVPLWFRIIDDKKLHLLLAFSGSFLLSITFLHLLPETFEEVGHKAGLYVLGGFFLQLIIQRFTHGVEHGHMHVNTQHDDHGHQVHLYPILLGLGIHAFMEGLPLGFNYRMPNTDAALFLAVGAHKLPEVLLVATLIRSVQGNGANAYGTLLLFSLCTPIASILASFLGTRYMAISATVVVLIPIVAGAFIHIATTIFFESGTRQHMLTWQKVLAMLLGVAISAATLLTES
jgi:zinc transporter ZupT